jgi:hypothetical protein
MPARVAGMNVFGARSIRKGWMAGTIGERSDAVLRTAIGERSDAVLRTAMPGHDETTS